MTNQIKSIKLQSKIYGLMITLERAALRFNKQHKTRTNMEEIVIKI